MRLKALSCNVFWREVAHCLVDSPHVVDVEFTELGEHVHSETLQGRLQAGIDAAAAAATDYDAVVLCFGICGNATVGLRANRVPLIVPRAHDCCALLLGSRETFRTHFADNPSTPFGSVGYLERGDYYLRTTDGEPTLAFGDQYQAYVEMYGEDNARYIWDTMHPPTTGDDHRAVFIDVPETHQAKALERFKTQATDEGRDVTVLTGNLRWLRDLLHGNWEPDDILTVPPGSTIHGVYDWSEVIRANAGRNEEPSPSS